MAPGASGLSNGAAVLSDGTGVSPNGAGVSPNGAGVLSNGAGVSPNGAGVLSNGAGVLSNGAGVLSNGASVLPNGAAVLSNGASVLPNGVAVLSNGAGVLSDGVTVLPNDEAGSHIFLSSFFSSIFFPPMCWVEAGSVPAPPPTPQQKERPHMGDGTIPRPDGLALTWMKHLLAGIAAEPSRYDCSQPDCENLAVVVGNYDRAYTLATGETTRTKPSIDDKDVCRAAAEQTCRQFANLIRNNGGISDSDKIAIGIRPANPDRTPIFAPRSSPLLNVVGATPGSQTVRYADSSTPDSGRKPFGAIQLQLFVVVDEAGSFDPEAGRLVGNFTRNPVGVAFAHADNGKVATYFARWGGRRGDVGPWSLPVAMRIAA